MADALNVESEDSALPNAIIEESLCKAAGISNCSNASFSKMLEISIEACGVEIFNNYEP